MILALGDFNPVAVARAALEMAEGQTAQHSHPVRRHPDGWGALWEQDGADGLHVLRGCSPLGEVDVAAIFGTVSTRMLAIHARHASDPANVGANFTHPVVLGNRAMMHNGFAPNIATMMGRPKSVFDTAELLEYLFGSRSEDPTPSHIISRLRAVGPGMTSANSFTVTVNSIFVVNWFDEASGLDDYYTLWTLRSTRARIFASEIVPSLAPPARWRKLGHSTVFRLPHQHKKRIDQ